MITPACARTMAAFNVILNGIGAKTGDTDPLFVL